MDFALYNIQSWCAIRPKQSSPILTLNGVVFVSWSQTITICNDLFLWRKWIYFSKSYEKKNNIFEEAEAL